MLNEIIRCIQKHRRPTYTDPVSMLGIQMPEIYPIGCLFIKDGNIVGTNDCEDGKLPKADHYCAGFYDDKRDFILIATYVPHVDPKTFKTSLVPASQEEKLFELCHELRHVWQKKYHEAEFYGKNAVGLECATDLAEIDADAFALMYVFEKAKVDISKLSELISELAILSAMDGWKRFELASRLGKEYLGTDKRIKEVQEYMAKTDALLIKDAKMYRKRMPV